MTVDDVQNAAIAVLFILGGAQCFLLWRINAGCRHMAKAVYELQRRR